MMGWNEIGTMAAALMAFIALNAGTLRWLFERHESATAEQMASLKREGSDFSHEVERQVMKLRAQLPLEYVRREDWIRFSSRTPSWTRCGPSCGPKSPNSRRTSPSGSKVP
jgi:hypothetical protein